MGNSAMACGTIRKLYGRLYATAPDGWAPSHFYLKTLLLNVMESLES